MLTCEICGKEVYLMVGHLPKHKISWTEYKSKFPNAKNMSPEVSKKQSIRNIGNSYKLGCKESDETRLKKSKSHLGLPSKIIGRKRSAEVVQKQSLRLIGNKYRLGIRHTEDIKRKIGLKSKALWENPEYRVRCQLANWRACNCKPNKTELLMLSLLGDSWRYTGDSTLLIANKNPDFWNGDHKLIELFGDYWHRGENPQDRIDIFEKNGYKCLVIWEHELENIQEVKQRINNYELMSGIVA